MLLYLLDILEAIQGFYERGGIVLYFITALSFVMWVLILERAWYYLFTYKTELNHVMKVWKNNKSTTKWGMKAIRNQLISETQLKVNQNLSLIKTLVMVCPLFGLLGTVTGMIEVFTVLSVNGGSDVRSMAGGVSRATIPTMAGMVSALAGVFALTYLNQKANRESQLIDEHLSLEKNYV